MIDEAAYRVAERIGKRLNDLICPDCPSPGDCGAEGACIGRSWEGQSDAPTLPEWDAIEDEA